MIDKLILTEDFSFSLQLCYHHRSVRRGRGSRSEYDQEEILETKLQIELQGCDPFQFAYFEDAFYVIHWYSHNFIFLSED